MKRPCQRRLKHNPMDNTQSSVIRLDVIRHGHCEGDAYFRGQSPVSLSDVGRRQMECTFSKLCTESMPDWVVSSTAHRCSEATQRFFGQAANLQLWLDEQLQERDFGDWQGVSYSALQARSPHGLADYFSNPFHYVIPNAESLIHFTERSVKAVEKWVEKAFDPSLSLVLTDDSSVSSNQTELPLPQHLLLVTHGGVMRVLLQCWLRLDNEALFQFELGYASRLQFEIYVVKTENVVGDVADNQGALPFSKRYFIKLVVIEQSAIDSMVEAG